MPIFNFKVRDAVMISKVGERAYNNNPWNPHGVVGRVSKVYGEQERPIWVNFENGERNCYYPQELMHAKVGYICRS